MEIKIGEYILHGDALNLWITKDSISRDGVHSEKRVTGYARNFDELYMQFVDTALRGSDATQTKRFLKEVTDARQELLSLWPEILDACTVYGKEQEKALKRKAKKGSRTKTKKE